MELLPGYLAVTSFSGLLKKCPNDLLYRNKCVSIITRDDLCNDYSTKLVQGARKEENSLLKAFLYLLCLNAYTKALAIEFIPTSSRTIFFAHRSLIRHGSQYDSSVIIIMYGTKQHVRMAKMMANVFTVFNSFMMWCNQDVYCSVDCSVCTCSEFAFSSLSCAGLSCSSLLCVGPAGWVSPNLPSLDCSSVSEVIRCRCSRTIFNIL